MTAVILGLLLVFSPDFHYKGDLERSGVFPFSVDVPLILKARKNLISPDIEFSIRKPVISTVSPFYSSSGLYFITKSGDIYRYYGDELKLIVKLKGQFIATPEVVNDRGFVVDAAGKLYIVDFNTEKVVLEMKPASAPLFNSPAVTENRVFLLSPDGEMASLTHGGEIKKMFYTNNPEKTFANKAPAVDTLKKIIFITDGKGTLYSLDYTFREKWKRDTLERLFRLTVVPSEKKLVAGAPYRILTYNEEDGKNLWRRDIIEGLSDFAVYNNNVFVLTEKGELLKLSLVDGRMLKKAKVLKKGGKIAMTENGKIVVGSYSGELVVLSKELKVIERINLEGGIHSAPVIWKNIIGVITDRGEAYVFAGK